MYNCPRCGYYTDLKNNMKRHLNRKSVCIVKYKNISIRDCKIMFQEGNLKQNRETNKIKYICHTCDKHFDRKSRLSIHMEKCSIEILNIVKEQQKQIKELIEINKKANVNNNTDNSTNYTNCGNINIHINPFKDTDYGALKDEIIKCLENQDTKLKVPMFEQIIDAVHFNKDKPENHNIYKPNVRDDRILTYNGEDFVVDKLALDKILSKLEDIIEKYVVEKDISKNYLKKLKEHLQLKRNDQDYIEATKDDISIGLYNGRNMVKNTHKSK
jgi:DNA-directed RNA polymerase subunit RPC12/RpoP